MGNKIHCFCGNLVSIYRLAFGEDRLVMRLLLFTLVFHLYHRIHEDRETGRHRQTQREKPIESLTDRDTQRKAGGIEGVRARNAYLSWESTTPSVPILQVPQGWYTVIVLLRMKHSQ